jgi:AcrR family transcriptional regulator
VVEGLRERKKRATRRAISDAATALFMEKGFEHTSVAEVAEVVGVSPQTVLNYFPTKTDLFFDEELWYAGPPQAVRAAGQASPGEAVLRWYLADLQRRAVMGHLDGLAIYLQTINDSETLRRRRLDDLSALAAALQTALHEMSPHQPVWDAQLAASVLTSAIMVAESEAARLSCGLAGTELLHAAQSAATSIFDRISIALSPHAAGREGIEHG